MWLLPPSIATYYDAQDRVVLQFALWPGWSFSIDPIYLMDAVRVEIKPLEGGHSDQP